MTSTKHTYKNYIVHEFEKKWFGWEKETQQIPCESMELARHYIDRREILLMSFGLLHKYRYIIEEVEYGEE